MQTATKPTSSWPKRFRWFLLLSIFLHLLFAFFYGVQGRFFFFIPEEKPQKPEEPLVFEVVESPENAPEAEPDRPTNLVSDKATRAANPQRSDQPGDTPYSEGDITERVLPQVPAAPSPPTVSAEQPEPAPPTEEAHSESEAQTSADIAYFPPPGSFSRDVLLGKKPTPPSRPEAIRPQPKMDSRKFSVDQLGGFALNTYDWNFAPYLLYLKKRIQQHIYPPPAFTRMGIIEGRTVLRFIISKKGKLEALQILRYEGHQSLMITSRNAVEISAPFRPLPADFPEEYLEVTATFVYKIYR